MLCSPFDFAKINIILRFRYQVLPLIFSEDQSLILSNVVEEVDESLNDKCMRTFLRILRNLFNRPHVLTQILKL